MVAFIFLSFGILKKSLTKVNNLFTITTMNMEIRKIAADRGVTMKQAAIDLGMTRQNLHRILSRKARRSDQTLRVANRLGIDERLLLPDNDDGNKQISCQQCQ